MVAEALFRPISYGGIKDCANRIVMAPCTRLRADVVTQVLPDYSIEYYTQRASAGMIIVEATNISEMARGYAGSPGIFTRAHIDQWRKITDAVHARGAKIVCQLWHTGPMGHESLHPGRAVQGPSTGCWNTRCNICDGESHTRSPSTDCQEMTKEEIKQTIEDYAQATRNAEAAGFDGVEVHAAHSYLLCSFMFPHTNKRTDEYGPQSFENRARFLLEVLTACKSAAYKSDNPSSGCHVGVRVSPYGSFNNIHSGPDSHEFAKYLFTMLDKEALAYVHISEPEWARGVLGPADDDAKWDPDWDLTEERYQDIRACLSKTTLIGSGGYDVEKTLSRIDRLIDAVAFGRSFMANPDLVERIKNGWPINKNDPKTSYFGGTCGMTDYPTYEQELANPTMLNKFPPHFRK